MFILMKDEVRSKLKRLGSSQRRIILWLGEQQQVTSLEELKKRWPATEPAPDVATIVQGWRDRVVDTPYAPYLTETYFRGEAGAHLNQKGWVEWSPAELLGRPPTAAESTLLSKGVRQLERRGLLKTEKAAGKHTRITHAKLTFHGEVASVLLRREEG